jgi:hypothetical protein
LAAPRRYSPLINTSGIIKNEAIYDIEKLHIFAGRIGIIRKSGNWNRSELIELFNQMIPDGLMYARLDGLQHRHTHLEPVQ